MMLIQESNMSERNNPNESNNASNTLMPGLITSSKLFRYKRTVFDRYNGCPVRP